MKKLSLFLIAALTLGLLAGCAGTPVVYYTECNCPTHSQTGGSTSGDNAPENAGAVKTGLALVGSAADSKNAAEAAYDVTIVGVTVDNDGVIRSCIIDSLGAKVTFDGTGTITSDLSAPVLTKNELGDNYGMKAYGGAKYEWYEQAAALADYAVGKTVDELKNGAIDETGKAPAGSDLASSATIYLGGYVSAIETAAANAQHLGAQTGDELRLATTSSVDSSKNASADGDGLAQLDCTVTALTVNGGKITSCFIDSLQAKVNFDRTGTIITDLSAPLLTKNQLGEDYGMVAWGGAIAEWDKQAASFAAYVTGKTADEVAGIAVNEKTAPTNADLSSSVTIAIGGFQALIAKAMQG
ncbi:MAG: hypothetical protein J6A62_06725 [Oscillospiraceae bacterium]|nr:hypothetical protein [Oscillospiraceae bacterium]